MSSIRDSVISGQKHGRKKYRRSGCLISSSNYSGLMVVPAHFTPARTREEAKALFASSVRQVEIEVFTYCNRTCWFCPNSKIDRRSANTCMDEALYLRILSDLAEINY